MQQNQTSELRKDSPSQFRGLILLSTKSRELFKVVRCSVSIQSSGCVTVNSLVSHTTMYLTNLILSGNFVTQAAQMNGHGIPNDLMQNFDPIAIIVFVPVLDRLVYPALRKARIAVPPITRIVIGFIIMAFAMAYAAVTQHYIYQAGPCYGQPLCDASIVDGVAQGVSLFVH